MDVHVYIWGTKAGTLRYNEETRTSSFQYDLDFIKMGIQLSPIIMPLSTSTFQFNDRIKTNYGLPPLLRDSLPDTYGNDVINLYLSNLNREENSLTPAERLCYEGKRGMGALEFKPDTSSISRDVKIDLSELVSISSNVYEDREKLSTNDIVKLFNVSTSAGGKRSKAVVQYNFKTKEFKSGQIEKCFNDFDYFIIKFDDFKNDAFYTRIEYAYYLMAKDCGIDIMNSYLLKEDGKYHFLTKRFDRVKTDNKVIKIHTQTLMSLCQLDYDIPGEIGYEYVFGILKRLGIHNKNEQWFRRAAFNVITKNMDDHCKNTSFVMNRNGQWDLSNAYDLTYSYNPIGQYTYAHQMTINKKNDNILLEDILELAKEGNIKTDKAIKIVKEIENVVSNFKKYAERSDLPESEINKIQNEFVLLTK